MIVRLENDTIQIDDCDADLADRWMRDWITEGDLQKCVAARMDLPDCMNLTWINGNRFDCHRSNIDSVATDPPAKIHILHDIGFRIGDQVVVTLSREDQAYVTQWDWYINPLGYVYRYTPLMWHKRRMVYLHRVIARRMGLNTDRSIGLANNNRLCCTRLNVIEGRGDARKSESTSEYATWEEVGEAQRLISKLLEVNECQE